MTAKDVFTMTIDTAHWITTTYLEDLSDADLLVRPLPGMNPVAWQLGHLICSEHQMVSALGHSMPALPDGFAQAHSKEAAAGNDTSKFAGKSGYVSLMKKMHEATKAALLATADTDLDKPGPEQMRSYAPTVGAVFNIIGTHEFMHHGQIVALRRKLGKPVVV